MTDDEHPLVAVVGLGSSIPETLSAAETLGDKHVASIGAVLSSTDMVTNREHDDDTLFKVSPSSRHYATALGEYLDPLPANGLLVQDSNDDNYVRTLGQALTDRFGEHYAFDRRTRWFAGSRQPAVATPTVFGPVADAVCEYDTDVVFYAGRERDLPELITAMAGHRCRKDKPRYIATGTTGLGRTQADPKVLANLHNANLRIIDATSIDMVEWGRTGQQYPVPPNYEAFHRSYRGMGLAEGDLIDGYVVGHHDALAVAVFAARQAAENLDRPPSAGDVLLQLKNLRGTDNPVPAAGGDLTFGTDGWPVGRFVPIALVPQEPVDRPSHVTGEE
jgi:hypothetical protein